MVGNYFFYNFPEVSSVFCYLPSDKLDKLNDLKSHQSNRININQLIRFDELNKKNSITLSQNVWHALVIWI